MHVYYKYILTTIDDNPVENYTDTSSNIKSNCILSRYVLYPKQFHTDHNLVSKFIDIFNAYVFSGYNIRAVYFVRDVEYDNYLTLVATWTDQREQTVAPHSVN